MVYRFERLGFISHEELVTTLAQQRPVTAYDLSDNSLYRVPGEVLGRGLEKTFPTITHLDLSKNALYRKSGSELGKILAPLKSIRTLNLANNDFGLQAGVEFVKAMSSLSLAVHDLDLSNNRFELKPPADLIPRFLALAPSIFTLRLRHNQLSSRSEQELKQIFGALDWHITEVDLRDNGFEDSLETLESLFKLFPAHITHLTVSSETFISRSAFQKAAALLKGIHFDYHLAAIKTYVQGMSNQKEYAHHPHALRVGIQLIVNLEKARLALMEESGSPEQFKITCLNAIKVARPVLESYGWRKQMLHPLGQALVSVLPTGISQRLSQHGLFKAPAPSMRSVSDLHGELHKVFNVKVAT